MSGWRRTFAGTAKVFDATGRESAVSKADPELNPKIRLLIEHKSQANLLWGAPRNHDRLLLTINFAFGPLAQLRRVGVRALA